MYDGLSLEELGVNTWNKIVINNNHYYDDWLLLWTPALLFNQIISGFEFRCVTLQTVEGNSVNYTTVFHGSALFDGVRHIYFGSEEPGGLDGYFNYPDIPSFSNALLELDKLTLERCEYVAKERQAINQRK